MITPTVRAALGVFQQAANRGTAVYLSPELVQELRDALKAEPEGEGPALDHANLISFAFGREPWATWLRKGGCLESAHCELSDLMLAAIVRWGRPATPPSPETPAEALAARPLLEQVAAMADCIGAHTVGQITAISNRAAAWLRENPPGQPVAIEPRGCPTPGACSCVEPIPPAPELGELVAWLKEEAEAYRNTCGTNLASQNLGNAATLLQQQESELAALRGVPVSEPLPTHDMSNAAPLLWLLWHHQRNHSPIGQHIRKYLGMGQFEPMSDAQIGAASFYQALGAETGSESSLSGFSDGEMPLG